MDISLSNLIRRCLALCLLPLSLALAGALKADNLTVSVGELSEAIDALDTEPDAITRLALLKIQERLNKSDLSLSAGELLFTDSRTDVAADSGCTRTEVHSLDTALTLLQDSILNINLSALDQPMVLALELDTTIAANGRARQVIGFRLGSCRQLATDSFSFNATGNALLNLELTLELNPTLNRTQHTLLLRPEVSLDGTLVLSGVNAEVDDSLLRSLLEDLIEDQIRDAVSGAKIVAAVQRLETKLREALNDELDNGELLLELPPPTDAQINALYRQLSPQGDFSLSLGYMRTQRIELLAALVVGDDDEVNRILSEAVQCEAAGLLQEDIAHQPLFQLGDNGCEATQIPRADEQPGSDLLPWYSDARCMNPLDYHATTTIDFCTDVLNKERLGNADSRVEELQKWTLSPGTRFDIGAVSLLGKLQPFTQRVSYKTVDTPMGQCSLEMRIHRRQVGGDSSQAPQRALIAYHGGSWQHRSSGALGIESMATQFVNEGFVVFAPFYRLAGDAEGTQSCNNASLEDIMEDAHDALDWVSAHAADYGITGKPVLFGQSAGGHLAALLATERPAEIGSAVLFYAPTDFEYYALQLRDGEVDSAAGQSILETIVGQSLDSLDVNVPLIQRNTLPKRIINEGIAMPPLFLLHGRQDRVLPYNQSIRLCNALQGNTVDGPATENSEGVIAGAASVYSSNSGETLRQIVHCGFNNSELHLIAEGEHALDLCIAEELCLSGSPQSAALTEDSVRTMLGWINRVGMTADDQPDTVVAGDGTRPHVGGGSLGWWALCLMLMVSVRRSMASTN